MTVDIRDLFDRNARLVLLQVQDAQVALCPVEVQAAYGLAVVIVNTARSRIRDQLSPPMTQEIKKWMRDNAGGWTGSNLNCAISYTSKRWKKLTLFGSSRSPVAQQRLGVCAAKTGAWAQELSRNEESERRQSCLDGLHVV